MTSESPRAQAPGGAESDAPPPHPGHGTGTRLWLARHAEVHADWRGRAYGDLDVPLSEEGLARTVVLGAALAALPPTRVLSSPLERARRLGAEVARGAGLPLEADARLREIHRGAWQGRSVAELHEEQADDVRAFYAAPWDWRGHGGESDSMVAARAWEAIDEALAGPAGVVVLTTHYNVIRIVVGNALGVPPERSFAFRVDPGRACLLVDAPGGWQLHRSNVLSPEALEELPA